MRNRVLGSTVEEDLKKLNIPGFSMVEQAVMGGVPLHEDKSESQEEEVDVDADADVDIDADVDAEDEDFDLDEAKFKPSDEQLQALKDWAKEHGKKWKSALRDAWMSGDYKGFDNSPALQRIRNSGGPSWLVKFKLTEDVDPLDAPDVNMELFDAIMDLPYDSLTSEDVEEVIEALKGKNLPEDAPDALKERAEEVVDFLVTEGVAKRQRRFKAGSMAKTTVTVCKPGKRKDPKDKTGKRCIPAAKAAGGKGKLMRSTRKKALWSRGGSGAKSGKKSARFAARREGSEPNSFAAELLSLVEDTQAEAHTLRDELLERILSIFEMLAEEFNSDAVTRVFEENFEKLNASWEAGRLDEDVMDEEDFIAELKPVLTLVHKSLEKIDSEDTSGN